MFDQSFEQNPDLPPDVTLITGPVGCGKTEAAIEAILWEREFRAFGTVWVLLATDQQIHAFRQRLLARSQDSVQFGVEFFNFYSLYARILDRAGDPQRLVEGTARLEVLRWLIAELRDKGALEHFAGVAHLPGFVAQTAALIAELKQGLALPETFAQVAQARGPKDRDLARIYSAYQDYLRARRLVDRHGAGWLAVDHLKHDPGLVRDVDLLIVDGYDQFNRVHVRLLAELVAQVRRTVVTLAGVPGEGGRRFRRFGQTRERLLAAVPDVWQVQTLTADDVLPDVARPPVLEHLSRVLLRAQGEPLPGDDSLILIEAPDVQGEVQAVLRRVKRLLLDGAPPESVVIVARRLGRYAGPLRETARAYGIPLAVRTGVPLRENPAVAAVLALLDLAGEDFPRRALLDTLASPYLSAPDLSADQMAQLERISLALRVVRGRSAWLEAVRNADLPHMDEEGQPLPPDLLAAEAEGLYAALSRHFDRLTPPERGTVHDFAAWVTHIIGSDPDAAADETASGEESPGEDITGHFDVLGCVRASSDAERVALDVLALHELVRVLEGQRVAHDLVAGDGPPRRMDWEDFWAELQQAVRRASIPAPGGAGRLGRVLATDVLEVRGLPHDHVLVLGLAEGEFPIQEPEETLYQLHERDELERAGIDVQTALERSDDSSLFYQVVGLARRSLTLSRPTVDDKGAPCPPSPFWGAVRAAVAVPAASITRVAAGAAPSLAESAALDETAVAVAAALGSNEWTQAAAVHNALLHHPLWAARWVNVCRGRALEFRREDPAQPFDQTTGVLHHPALVARTAQALGPEHTWSASQLNDYGQCPFRFFARRVLGFEVFKEPEEGLDAPQIGSINHAILELAYREIAAEGLSIGPDNQAFALQILDEAAAQVLDDAPARFGFRASPLWASEQAALRERLRRLVALDFSDLTPLRLRGGQKAESHPLADRIGEAERYPYALEVAFGLDDTPPLRIEGPAGPLYVRGKIDRLDRAGNQIVLVDYKTGSARHPVSDMAAGRDFQMMIYLLAAEMLLAEWDSRLEVAGGLFWHINDGTVSGEVRADNPAVALAYERLHACVQAGRAGCFAIRPGKISGGRCAGPCDFIALCRWARPYSRKPLPEGWAVEPGIEEVDPDKNDT